MSVRETPADPDDARAVTDGRAYGSTGSAGSVLAGCLAIGLVTAVLGLPPSLNGLIASRLGISGEELTWVGDVGFVGAAASGYLLGTLSERLGRKRILLFSAVLTALGQLVSSVAGTVQVLYLGQGLSGIGLGGLGVISLAVVLDASRTPQDRSRNLGAFAGSLTLGGVVSALLGGIIAVNAGYQWAFFAMAVVSAVVAVAIQVFCSESRAATPAPLDLPGQVTLIVGLVAILWAVIDGGANGWTSGSAVAGYVVAAVALIVFVLLERRPGAMITLSLFRIPSFSGACAVAVVSFFAFAGSIYVYALRVTVVQDGSALFSAMGLVVISLVSGVAGFLSRELVSRWLGVKALVVGGLVCFAAADFWIAWIPISHDGFSDLAGFMILIGLGQATTIAGMTTAAVASAGPEKESQAAGSQGVLRQVGAPLGVAIAGAIAFGNSQTAFERVVGTLGLSAQTAGQVSGVNEKAGVLGILASGLGRKVPAAGEAAAQALGAGLADAARTVGAVCLIMAVIALVTVGRWNRDEIAPGRR